MSQTVCHPLRGGSRMRPAAATLFGGSVLVVVVVGIILGGLAPIETAAGQTQTQTQTQNQSNASVEFANQTTNGSTVTVKRAVLPDGGFVVLSNDPYSEIGLLKESMIAVSEPLSPGTHRNITLDVQRSPPSGYINQTRLNTTSDYSVGLYRDTNNNSRFEYITSTGTNDAAYLTGTGTERRFVSDAASISVPESNTPTPNASIHFRDQSTNGAAVAVDSVTLPRGGFVVVHSESYLQGGDPLQSAIGLSAYLPAGTHQNVTVALTNGSVQQRQTLVAIPSQDTNQNRTYDYVRSDGFQDVPYTAENKPVTGKASVTVSSSTVSTSDSSPTPTTTAATSTRTDTSRPATSEAGDGEDGGDRGLVGNILFVGVIIVLVVVVGGYLLIQLRS
jgi:hypothetical protein